MKDPYLYDDCNVLKNILDLKDKKKLDNFESSMVNLGIINLLNNLQEINSILDIFMIHKILFENVYVWAGEIRKINMYKSEYVLDGMSVVYEDYKNIEKKLKEIQIEYDKIIWNKLNKNEIIEKLSVIIADIWKVHPFREGNTRAVTLLLYYILKKLNLKVDKDFIGKHSKYFRNALVLASLGEYREMNYLEDILKDAVYIKKVDGFNNNKYISIKGYNLEKYEYNYHTIKK